MPYRISIVCALCLLASARGDEAELSFNRDVRPILADKCFACHGPDENHRQADLRLDRRDAAVADRGGYAAIVPGDAEASEVMARVASDEAELRMPPVDSGKRLSAVEVERLRRWIEQGAPYEGHWAFLPLRAVEPPDISHDTFSRSGIDRFILKRLTDEGLSPSGPADRSTLIRRVYLDLIGLLPPADEVDRFLRDDRPEAYDELVDRLLKSPHFGERWGRHWLDQARYADSNGYTIDGERVMWPYRDWVIKALNNDMPFDQFTIEQLAGDLLPEPTKEQFIATGFHRNTLINQEGGTDPEQFRIEAVMDRVATTGAVWLGLTVGCAQCHAHKFDPISHEEYYRFYAFFNHSADVNNVGPTVEVHEGELFLQGADAEHLAELNTAMAELDRLRRERPERQAAWEAAVLANVSDNPSPHELDWTTFDVAGAHAEAATLTELDDHSLLATPGVLREIYVVQMERLPRGTTVGSIQLRVTPHPSLPKNGPGLAANGNFVLSGIEVYLGDERLPLVAAIATHAQAGYPASSLVDDDPGTGWAINVDPGSAQKMNAEHTAWIALGRKIVTDDRSFKVILKHELNNDYNVGRFQLAWSEASIDSSADPTLLQALRTAANERTRDQKAAIERAFAAVDEPYKTALGKVDACRRRLGLGPAASTMVLAELPERRTTYLLKRGDFLQPDQERGPLEPDVFAVLPDLPACDESRPRNRLDLARWLVHPDNPLTPRVTVNRIWMRYFGRGLVETENDFGAQSSPPTHPDLLDWLARQFIGSGWSQKHIHRLIVSSATYRQSSYHRPDLSEADPLNVLLARQSRLRLDAEIVRDAALSASGKLNPRIGGPSVFPPQPDGVYAFTQNRKSWPTAEGPDRFRRTMYTMFYRSAPHPMFTTFDAPDFQSVCTRRTRSNTPLQALAMSNDRAMIELAEAFAERILADATAADDQARIERAFLIAYARRPSAAERERVERFLAARRDELSGDSSIASGTPGGRDSDADALAEQTSWTAVARALMNTDEFITRE